MIRCIKSSAFITMAEVYEWDNNEIHLPLDDG